MVKDHTFALCNFGTLSILIIYMFLVLVWQHNGFLLLLLLQLMLLFHIPVCEHNRLLLLLLPLLLAQLLLKHALL